MAELYSTAENFDRLKADDLKNVLAKQEYAGQDAAEIAHRCGGTLIARDLVVTAAHCVANKADFDGTAILTVPRVRRVRLGTLDLCDGCGSTYKIVGVAVHAGYDPHGKVNTDDIALLRIAADESTDPYTKPSPIVLGTAPIGHRDALLLYGWGFTHQSSAFGGNDAIDLQGNAQLTPKALQFGLVERDPKDCGQEMQREDMPDGVVCVIGRTHNVFSCRGDSGGPLTRKNGRREEIVGLTSWSYGCGDKFPSVYTDVTHYTRWISLAAKQLRARAGVIKVNAAGALVPAVAPAPPALRSN
jgi:secreted trypsin-like serine protease